jgi:hypothetical protein
MAACSGWKHQSISRIGQRRRIARLVLPGLKVHRLYQMICRKRVGMTQNRLLGMSPQLFLDCNLAISGGRADIFM